MWYKLKRIMMRPNGVEKQVRPSRWQPWANTIAYYPLDSTNTTNDLSWNSYNLTNSSISFGTYQWVDCAYNFGYNKWLYTSSWYSFTLHDYTFGAWFYKDDSWNSTFRRIVWPYEYAYLIYNKNTGRLWVNNADTDAKSIVTTYDRTRWNFFLITFDSSTSTDKMYLNWELKTTFVDNEWTQRFNWRSWVAIWCNKASDSYDYWGWWISNVVIEDKVWTDQEIASYYNSTKWNYWL